MTAAFDMTTADPQQIIADLRRELAARTAELHENKERYALDIRAVAEGIYDWDIAHNRLWVSPRLIELFGWEAGEGIGERPSQDWNARVHPEDFASYRAALRATLKGETARLHCEYRIRLSSAEYRWVEDHAVPVRDERGWAVRLVGAVSDVTERKQQEQELREALERQTATAEVLQVINSSPGDLTPVFDAILEKAARLCDASLGIFWRYSGGLFHAATVHGAAEFADFLRSNPQRPPPGSDLWRLLQGEDVVYQADHAEGPSANPALNDAFLRLGGGRAGVIVALRNDSGVLGAIRIFRQDVRPFTDKQIALLQNFAAQAVIAMENARLLNELQDRTRDLQESLEYQTATSDVLKVISRSTFDLQPVLDAMTETSVRLCTADSGHLAIRQGEGYRAVATCGVRAEHDPGLRSRIFVPGRDTVIGRTLLERQIVHVADLAADPEYGVPSAINVARHPHGDRCAADTRRRAYRRHGALPQARGTLH